MSSLRNFVQALFILLLVQGTAVQAAVQLRPYESSAASRGDVGVQAPQGCDDGTVGGTLVQRLDDWYGNAFPLACSGARVTSVQFQHLGYGLEGPYFYRLHLVDASCATKRATGVLQVSASAAQPTWVQVDLSAADWCVQGDFQIFLEPLSCVEPLSGQDCFPALVVDSSSDTDPGAHCAQVNTQGALERTCAAARSTDGRYFDFVLRAELDCNSTSCSTAVAPINWTLLKSLYRAP